MDFDLPKDLIAYLAELDAFIEAEIKPLQAQDDNERFFDHRRENARTDWDNDGIPTQEWEELLSEMRRRADKAGWLRYGLPASLGGRDGTNIDMAVIREHPLRERLWELRILALYRAGRQAEALQACTEVRDRLFGELGIDPGPALRDLEARILAQHPSLSPEPVSETDTSVNPSGREVVRISSSRRSLSRIASRALRTRLMTTCWT